MHKQEVYLAQIDTWEYCYCRNCDEVRYSFDLRATEHGIQCSKCEGYDLEAPGWVICPHDKVGAVKCPRAGKGIVGEEYGVKCKYRCDFRKPKRKP